VESELLSLMHRAAAVHLSRPAVPDVSVIVPVHGHLDATVLCLESLAAAPVGPSFEVIVVDDASPDDTPGVLPLVEGIEVLRPQANVGFLRACNLGARHARGRWLVLLNNDTEVTPHWLDALLEAATLEPGVGAVGARLVYPDGRLQEAGGVIWSNASGWNFGRFEDPDGYLYRVRRDVDYCSAACLLVETALWNELGGFDELFVPAYYEDTDLCFRIRRAGKRVLYAPDCVVVHHEGVSHGTDTGTGGKRHQVKNRQVFSVRWSAALRHQYPEDPGRLLLRARDRRAGSRVVIFEHRVPEPDMDSGSVRMSRLIQLLRELGYVIHFVPADGARREPYASALEADGVEICAGPGPSRDAYLECLGPEVALAIVARPDVGEWAAPLVWRTCPRAVVLYDMVDGHGRRERRRAELEADEAAERRAVRYERLERSLGSSCDAVICVTEHDRTYMEDLVGRPVQTYVLGNVHGMVEEPAPFAGREGLLFVGGYDHPPNVDAAAFLVAEVLPLVREQLGHVPLTLAGSSPPEAVRALAGNGILVPGWLPDLSPLYRTSRVMVAPLRYGAGMKGKVGESLSRGLPTVTTPDGVEGLDVEHGEQILVGRDAAELAGHIAALYGDRERWEAISRAGRQHVERNFGLEATRRRLEAILADLGITP
jgi:GT2 family glycosyltransferase